MRDLIKPGETERVAERQTFSKTMTRPDGKTVVRGRLSPVHWDDNETQRDIDMTPVDRGADYRATDGLYEVTVEKTRPGFVYTSKAGGEVTAFLQGASGAPVLDAGGPDRIKFTWTEALIGVDVQIQLRPSGLWTYTFIKSPTAIHSFVWSVVGAKAIAAAALESVQGDCLDGPYLTVVDGVGTRTITVFNDIAVEADYPMVLF